jgi:hypothetical protein
MNEPDLIRNDTPHEVFIPTGANLASGKKATGQEPSVRKVLASGQETIHQHTVDEQRFAGHEDQTAQTTAVLVDLALQLHDNRVSVPDTAPKVPVAKVSIDSPAESVNLALLPEALPEQRNIVLLPEDGAADEPVQGPFIERSQHDHFVALPEPVGDLTRHPVSTAVDLEQLLQARTEALSAESSVLLESLPRLPDLPPMADTPELPKMDIQARVGQLKIENDKVRSKLDALQNTRRS